VNKSTHNYTKLYTFFLSSVMFMKVIVLKLNLVPLVFTDE
jgi:hypothetical protein